VCRWKVSNCRDEGAVVALLPSFGSVVPSGPAMVSVELVDSAPSICGSVSVCMEADMSNEAGQLKSLEALGTLALRTVNGEPKSRKDCVHRRGNSVPGWHLNRFGELADCGIVPSLVGAGAASGVRSRRAATLAATSATSSGLDGARDDGLKTISSRENKSCKAHTVTTMASTSPIR